MTKAAVHPGTWQGLETVVLEHAALRVTIVPSMGGHVAELVDLAGDRDLLWHNPRMKPRPAPYGSWFDDWWSGGWDEIFPSGDKGTLHGESLPYMGELWCLPWDVEVGRRVGSVVATGIVQTTIAAARFERTLELRDDERILRASYRLTNLDVRPLPFAWGIHPCFAVTDAHRIDVPASRMLVGVSSGPAMGTPGESYAWPHQPDPGAPGGLRDASHVLPASAAVFGGHWATGLRDGWLALTHVAARRGVALAFDADVFPDAWLWQVYGGWRGHHHLCLEPWTCHPMELEAAQAAGRARELAPGASLEAEVAFVLFDGLDHVTSVDRGADGYSVR